MMVERYKCSHCAVGQTPEGIFAGPKGIRKIDPTKALKNKETRMPTPESDPVESEPVVEPAVDSEPVVEPMESEPVVELELKPTKKVAKKRLKRRHRF